MNENEPVKLLDEACNLGEKVKLSADPELYGAWNEVSLKLLRSLLGQASEHFLSFRFPGGGAAASSRDERIRNTIEVKVNILQEVRQQLANESLTPDLAWAASRDEMKSCLAEFHGKLGSTEQAN